MPIVSKRKLKSRTKWEARWNIPGEKKRHTKLFERKKDADAFLEQVMRQITDGIYVHDSDSVTTKEAGAAYIDAAIARGLRPETYKEYERHLEQYVYPQLSSLALTKLREQHIYELIDLVTAECSPKRAKKVLRTLNGLIREAQKRGWVGRNIIKDKDIRVEVSATEATYFPTKKEISDLIENAADKDRLILKTAVLTGLRLGELRALQWRDIDFEARILRVQRSATPNGSFKSPKSKAGKREIPMGDMLCLELKKWSLASTKNEKGLVFPNSAGNPMSSSNIRHRIFLPAMERAGLLNDGGKNLFRIHDLRHAAASLLIEQNLNPKRIQIIMGHSDIQTTFNVYGKLFKDKEADRNAVDAISASLFA